MHSATAYLHTIYETLSLHFDIELRKVTSVIVKSMLQSYHPACHPSPKFSFLCSSTFLSLNICSPHQPILAKVKTASSLVPPPTILTPSLRLSSTLLRAPKACTWVSLELSFTHNTNFKLQRQAEVQHTPELLSLGFSFGFNQPARVFGGKVLKGYKSFFTPSGSRDICHQLPLGARSCQSHAGRVSAAWRGGML